MTNLSLDQLMKGQPVKDVTYHSIIAEVSAYLALKRAKSKMTQEEFAKHLDISQSMLSKYENGTENLTVKTMAELLSKLNLSADLVCRHQDNQEYQPRETSGFECKDHGNGSLLRQQEPITMLSLDSPELRKFKIIAGAA
jgi:transcriptional regulator with XRE-family HTH domain